MLDGYNLNDLIVTIGVLPSGDVDLTLCCVQHSGPVAELGDVLDDDWRSSFYGVEF